MSERDPTQTEIDAAFKNMQDQKAAGEWMPHNGDIPQRLGPLPVPVGYRSLSELAHGLASVGAVAGEDAPWLVAEMLASGATPAFCVASDGTISRLPTTTWLNLMHDLGGKANVDLTVDWDCLTGGAFEPSYVGQMGIVREADFDAALSSRRSAQLPQARDPARPWLDFRSPSAWLSSHRSTAFIDEHLRGQGVAAPRPIDRDRALHDYLSRHGVQIELDSVRSRRRPSMMRD